jgi:hypothetical protein
MSFGFILLQPTIGFKPSGPNEKKRSGVGPFEILKDVLLKRLRKTVQK